MKEKTKSAIRVVLLSALMLSTSCSCVNLGTPNTTSVELRSQNVLTPRWKFETHEMSQEQSDPSASRSDSKMSIEDDSLSFAIIGDWGTGRKDQLEVFSSLGTQIRSFTKAETRAPNGLTYNFFILTTGDNFYPSGLSEPNSAFFQKAFVAAITQSGINTPFYASLGNHDHRSPWQYQVQSTHPQWVIPHRFYAFTKENHKHTLKLRFIALDTESLWRIDDKEQDDWIRQECQDTAIPGHERQGAEETPNTWRIMFGHHPIESSGPHASEHSSAVAREKILEYARLCNIDIYLAGHDHHLEVTPTQAGPLQIISGAAAGRDKAYPIHPGSRTFFAQSGGGFFIANIHDNGLELLPYNQSGERLSHIHITRRSARPSMQNKDSNGDRKSAP